MTGSNLTPTDWRAWLAHLRTDARGLPVPALWVKAVVAGVEASTEDVAPSTEKR